MPERVLLTGATGFVGSHLARVFLAAGYEVRCAARPTSDLSALEGLVGSAELATLDLGRPETLAPAVDGVGVVVHAAGITRAGREDDYHAVNAEGTQRLAAAAARTGVRRFVLISSLAARGPDAPGDGKGGFADRPVSAYGRSKLEAERRLRRHEGRMRVVALRPSAVYGPRDKDFLPLVRMARAGWVCVPAARHPLQPLYVDDLSSAVLAASREPVGFGPHPVAEAARYCWPEVLGALEAALGRRVRALPLPPVAFVAAGTLAERGARALGRPPGFDARRARDLALHAYTCDVSGTQGALGWRARTPLEEGLRRTVGWYRGAGWLGIKG